MVTKKTEPLPLTVDDLRSMRLNETRVFEATAYNLILSARALTSREGKLQRCVFRTSSACAEGRYRLTVTKLRAI